MKTCSSELLAMLNSGTSLKWSDLITFKLITGTILRYTSDQLPITVNGNTFIPLPMNRCAISEQSGINVGSLTIELYPKCGVDYISLVSLTEAFCNGTFDGAYIQLDTAFFSDWSSEPQILEKRFIGRVDVDTVSQLKIKLDVKAPTEILNIKSPYLLLESDCGWTLYGGGCGVNKANFTGYAYVVAGSTDTIIYNTLNLPEGRFEQGVWTGTSGFNNGITRTIKGSYPGSMVLKYPLPHIPQTGDTFSMTLGCNKTIADCQQKFNNRLNFSGKPYIPQSEVII